MAQFELKEDDKDLELDDLLIAGDDESRGGKKLVILGAVGVLLFAVVLVVVYFIQNSQEQEQIQTSDRAKEEIAIKEQNANTPKSDTMVVDKKDSAVSVENTDEQFQRIINQIKAQQQENNATLSKGAESLAANMPAQTTPPMAQKLAEPKLQEIKPLPEPVAPKVVKVDPKAQVQKPQVKPKVEPKPASAAPAVVKNASTQPKTQNTAPKATSNAQQIKQNQTDQTPKNTPSVASSAKIIPAQNNANKNTNPQTNEPNAANAAPKINPAGVGFYVQVGSFARLEPDAKLLKSLNASGYSYRSQRVGDTNRLLVGPFSSRQEAQDNLAQIRDKFSKEAFVREVQ